MVISDDEDNGQPQSGLHSSIAKVEEDMSDSGSNSDPDPPKNSDGDDVDMNAQLQPSASDADPMQSEVHDMGEMQETQPDPDPSNPLDQGPDPGSSTPLDQAVPHDKPVEETQPDPGPGTGTPLDQGVPHDKPAERGSAVRSSGYTSRKVHASPEDILLPLSPPCCTIRLNHNDHRWTATWRKDISSDVWFDELSRQSFSKGFRYTCWKEALARVHEHAWLKWQLAEEFLPELKLPNGRPPQEPGSIPEAVCRSLESIVASLSAAKQYHRK